MVVGGVILPEVSVKLLIVPAHWCSGRGLPSKHRPTACEELKEVFPYRVIHIDHAEADDIIGTLVTELSSKILPKKENILILSGDKDFIQLQAYNSSVAVKQFDPINKKYVINDDPRSFMKEHIMKGDVGDGIPNFLSPDNSFVDSIRQKIKEIE